ncbi:unnamed protein product [Hydatigera taeniaeformis]|uniref:Uncharacterized protein n=1 Tax=Hydatigena taeniaeformis TaxID=6205 RepID=A0A0R3WYH3_HYDTA|nr:unnamed protein product [Hydatigera taeniaeformis]
MKETPPQLTANLNQDADPPAPSAPMQCNLPDMETFAPPSCQTFSPPQRICATPETPRRGPTTDTRDEVAAAVEHPVIAESTAHILLWHRQGCSTPSANPFIAPSYAITIATFLTLKVTVVKEYTAISVLSKGK